MESLDKRIDSYKKYCQNFIFRYAQNEKMEAEKIFELIPDDWSLKEGIEGSSKTLLEYLALTLNDRLSKEINFKIAKHVGEMELLNWETKKTQLQKAYIHVPLGGNCKVCHRKIGGKYIYIYIM